jgi:hypothetical protein
VRRTGIGPRILALVLVAAALLGGGCAAVSTKEDDDQQAIPRPEWRVGDRWSFKRTALTGATAVVAHQVVATTTDGYTVRMLGLASEVTRQWTFDLHLAQETLGEGPTARFLPPAPYFNWPLKPAATWSQVFHYTEGQTSGLYSNTWMVSPRIEAIDTVAGRFYTIRVERWSGTQRLEAYWYSPRIRYWVRLEDYSRGFVEELVEVRSWSGS